MRQEIHNFCEETYWKVVTGQGNKNIKMDLAETVMENT
jgi:hypothetical protein